MKANWIIMGFTVMFLVISGSTYALDVTALYDGSVIANPDSVWTRSNSNDATLTPESGNGRVHIEVPATGYFEYRLSDVTPVTYAVHDDNYAWELTLEVATGHKLSEIRLITGTTTGSAGHYDRLFISDTGIQVIYVTEDTGYSTSLSPNTLNWTTMQAKNTIRYERYGNAVTIYVNGDLVFKGTSGTTTITSTQLFLTDNAANVVNQYWYSFVLFEDAVNEDYNAGYDAGHQAGYEAGYDDGYDDGYAEGLAVNNADLLNMLPPGIRKNVDAQRGFAK